MRIKTGLALTVLWLLARPGQAQTTQWTTQRYIEHSLRLSLQDAGFSEAIRASNPPDLDREVTSSQSGTSEYEFVAAYYFVDELNGVSLGPLHVSRFDNRTRRWTHSLTFSDDDARGSAQFVAIGDRFIIIRLHWTPSAGGEVVLDHDTLKFETLVRGFALSTGGSRIIFEANTVHFAPTHQAVLKEVEASTGRETEIFPGSRESSLARRYRQTVRDAYQRLTEDQQDTFRRSNYGPVDDFDREILNFDWNDDSSRLAFVVSYASARLQGQSLPGPAAEVTVARCDRSLSGTWSCTERDLIDAGKEFGVDLTQYRQQWVDPAPLLRRMLEKP